MSANQTYLQELNEVQQQAVTTTEGPVLVVAGPGSGKTRVLTYRVAYLIESGAKPWEILALTFTNKAAREMKERIGKVVGPSASKVWAGTFHSIFARILRVEADKLGYPSNFTIYDTDDTKSVLNTIIREMSLDKNTYNVNAIRSRISSAKSQLITPKLYAQDEELRRQDQMSKRPHLHAVYALYTARCKRSGAMDFDDLLYRFYELLQKNPDNVIEKYRKKFRYALVDEFQDTNHLQYAIVRKLINYEGSPRNICVVGDDAQSIYGFRGATIQNILDFEEDFKDHGIQVFKLEQNYRSTEHIVQAANSVITLNQKQIPKTIWSDQGIGLKIKVIQAMTDGEEGRRVADTILEQKNRHHLSNQEVAILYRTNAQSRVFEEYLRRYNIPYRVFGGMSFYQRKEIKDLLAYLRLAVNPNDDEALRRVINYPKRGIGNTTVEQLGRQAEAAQVPIWQILPRVQVSGRARRAIDEFAGMIRDFIQRAEKQDAYEVADHIARESGILEAVKGDATDDVALSRRDNLQSLLDGIKAFVEDDTVIDLADATEDKKLGSYLQNIALVTDLDEKSGKEDYVTLMSVHAAKGLEFKSVFITGLEEKLFPSQMALDNKEGQDEERRLFYVAITRAEQHLTLSYAHSRYRFGQMRYNQPSRFLNEIPELHLEQPVQRRSRMPAFDQEKEQGGNRGARVSGHFKKPGPARGLKVDPKDFHPDPPAKIQAGMKVLHLKFGKGKVLDIEGGKDNRVATIYFSELDRPEKRIMLKFAKLQILS